MVTIRDFARHAGVSPATVSRVVNGLVGYSDETLERVETAVKTRQTSVIGLLALWSRTPWPPRPCRLWKRKRRNAATP